MPKHLFDRFRPLILASKFNQTIMFVQSRFLDLLFRICLYSFFKNGRFGDPLRNPMGPKMAPQIDHVAPNIAIAKKLIPRGHIRDPGFHETIVITVPLGHRVF